MTSGFPLSGATALVTNPKIVSDGLTAGSSAMSFALPSGSNPATNNPFLINVGGQWSNVMYMTYSAPTMYSNLTTTVTSGQVITIWGTSFGFVSFAFRLPVCGTADDYVVLSYVTQLY